MSEFKQDLKDNRAKTLARLAVLQRMKAQAVDSDRASMFVSIERLIEAESRALSAGEPKNAHPNSD